MENSYPIRESLIYNAKVKNYTSALTIVLVLIFLSGMA